MSKKREYPVEVAPGMELSPGDVILVEATVTAATKTDYLFGDARVTFTADGMHYASTPPAKIVQIVSHNPKGTSDA